MSRLTLLRSSANKVRRRRLSKLRTLEFLEDRRLLAAVNDNYSTDEDTSIAAGRVDTVSYQIPAGTVGNQNFGGSLGMDFDVAQPITIESLGVFDSGSDGLANNITAHLYDRLNTSTAIATIVFTPGDAGTLVDGSRFKPLASPITLPVGFQGTIVGEGYSAAESLGNNGVAPIVRNTDDGSGAITFVGGGRFGTAGLFPVTLDGGPANRYAAGTFTFHAGDNTSYIVPGGTNGNQNFGGSIGMDFDVAEPITISELGVFDSGSNGLANNITAHLYDRQNTGTAMATLVFTPGDAGTLVGGSRFKPLADPITLPVGFQGTIVAEGYSAGELLGNNPGIVRSTDDGGGAITFVGGGRYGTAGLFPATPDGGPANRYAAGTFNYHAGDDTAYVIPGGTVGNQAFGGALGLEFNVASDIKVTELGVFDDGSNGLNRDITAFLYDRTNTATPLAQIAFTAGDPGQLSGGSRFKPLGSAITLNAGFQGLIVASGYGGGEQNGNVAGAGVGSTSSGGGAISFVGGGRWGTDPNAYPPNADGGPLNRYAAGSFRFSTDFGTELLTANDTGGVVTELNSGALIGTSGNGASVSLNSNGGFSYDPSGSAALQSLGAGQTVNDTFTYTLDDGSTSTATVTINVTGINDAPVARNDSFSATEGSVLNAPVSTEFVSHNVPTGTAGNQAFGGSLGMDFDITSPVLVTELGVFDDGSNGLANNITAHIYDRNNNGAPIATLLFTPADAGTLDGGSRFKPLGAPIQLPAGFQGSVVAEGYSGAEQNGNGNAGRATDDGNGSVVFVGGGRYGTAGLYPGTADGGPANRYAAGSFRFETGLLLNDTDIDATNTISITQVGNSGSLTGTSAAGAAVTMQADGSFAYDPTGITAIEALAAGGSLVDTFTYEITDGLVNATATVSINVSGVNDAPTGGDDSFSTDEDTSLTIAGVQGISHIVAAGTAGNQAFGGSLGMEFDVTQDISVTQLGVFDDGSNGLFATITAHIYDRTSTAAPVATLVFSPGDDGQAVGGSRFKALATPLQLPAGFQGTVVAEGYNGAERNGNSAGFGTTDASGAINFVGTGRFGTAGQYPATADGGPANRYGAGTFRFVAGLLANDTDVDVVDFSSIVGVNGTGSLNGTSTLGATVSVTASGGLSYDGTAANGVQSLAAGDTAQDNFTYQITDGNGGTASATITVNLTGINDQPVAIADAAAEGAATDEDNSVVIDVRNNDTDIDATDVLTITALDLTGVNGDVTHDGANVTYNPNGQFESLGTGQSATESFTYTITDGNSGSATATVTVTIDGVNDAPIAGDDAAADGATTDEDNSVTISVLANDTDVDGGALNISVIDVNGTIGSVSNNGGDVDYDPNGQFESLPQGATAADTFSYTVTDGNGGSDTADVVVTVNGVNDAPVPAIVGPLNFAEGGSLDLDASGSTDVDTGTVLTYRWDVDGNGDYAENITGATPSLTWNDLISLGLDDGPDGPRDVTVEVSDGITQVTATTTLTIDNTAPGVTISAPLEQVPNLPITFSFDAFGEPSPTDIAAGLNYDIDWGDGNSVSLTAQPDSVQLDHPFADFGTYTVTVTVSDKDGGSDTATHVINIVPVLKVGDNIFAGGTDARRDRIIFTVVGFDDFGFQQIQVRYNNDSYGPFDTNGNTHLIAQGGGRADRISISGPVNIPSMIDGGDGNDDIAGGTNDDSIFGGAGNDTILTGEGTNVADGGIGNDQIYGRSGNDFFVGGDGNDYLSGGSGDDSLSGDSGNDRLFGGGGMDVLLGGAGNDRLNGGSSHDILSGGDDNDQLVGSRGFDVLLGGDGLDALNGGNDQDMLLGGSVAFENDLVSLEQLLTEWSVTSNNIDTRISSILAGQGAPALNPLDDGLRDVLNGRAADDWILQGTNDVVSRPSATDRIGTL
jgi:VCBS repeat-containing protein